MVAYNFKERFAQAVEDGDKLQTIRAVRKRNGHAKVGDVIQLYTGQRTKDCRKLGEGTCVAVEKVHIPDRPYDITIDGHQLQMRVGGQNIDPSKFDNDFAVANGFEDYVDMFSWFQDNYILPFDGILIKWELN